MKTLCEIKYFYDDSLIFLEGRCSNSSYESEAFTSDSLQIFYAMFSEIYYMNEDFEDGCFKIIMKS